jgi:hypothetical protein
VKECCEQDAEVNNYEFYKKIICKTCGNEYKVVITEHGYDACYAVLDYDDEDY